MCHMFCLIISLAIVGLRLEAVISIMKYRLWKCLRTIIYFSLNKLIIIVYLYTYMNIKQKICFSKTNYFYHLT